MAKYEYPAGVLPDIERYGGDTTKWKIPLKRPDGSSYTPDMFEAYYCALTITPYSMAQNTAQEPVIVKNTSIVDDGAGGAMAEFEFEISDTLGLSGKYIYQIELYSEESSRVAQGYLVIKKNNNPYRINLEYGGNAGSAGNGSSIVGGFRVPVRGEDYWTDDDKHEIIAAVVLVLENGLEEDENGLVNAVLTAATPAIEALAPVRGTDYWTAQDQTDIAGAVITAVQPNIAALAPVRGTDYWTAADQSAVVTAATSAVMTAVQPNIAALAPVRGTDYWTAEDIASVTNDIETLVDDAVVGLAATVDGHTLTISGLAGSSS